MDKPKDSFKWFGEGFDGFPKRLPEDCVEYTIYVIDPKFNDTEKREQLRKVQNAGLRLIRQLTKGFIWQREGISLVLEREAGENFLRGRTNYGDSVEDEWLVVYILRELSRIFPEIWIQAVDDDGQFLLIEAAGVLPRWLNPEIADHRVWLNAGKLLIIGSEELDLDKKQTISEVKSLTFREALNVIEHYPLKLSYSPSIQQEAFHRLQKYPSQIMGSLHHAFVRIPRKLAHILHHNPSYISPAVEAFYLRDPIALRPLQTQDTEGLVFPPVDFVRVSTKFTKVGYAQIKSQQFDPPKAWIKALPSGSNLKLRTEAELGMKITSGFEMLMSDPQNQDKKAVREIGLLLEDLEAEGDSLPSDAFIAGWNMREDDDRWLNINFEDFDRELKGGNAPNASETTGGFGDKGAQENLRRIVARFEEFLNDDAAGAEGAEYLDSMDKDDGEDEEGENETLDNDSEPSNEDDNVSFDEDKFAIMMKEMMGMPSSEMTTTSPRVNVSDNGRTSSLRLADEVKNGLHEDMYAMEKELQEAGALQLNTKPDSATLVPLPKPIDGANDADPTVESTTSKEKETETVDIDFNLARNLLESVKSQAGAPGPGSNLLGLMGMQMPREEYEQG